MIKRVLLFSLLLLWSLQFFASDLSSALPGIDEVTSCSDNDADSEPEFLSDGSGDSEEEVHAWTAKESLYFDGRYHTQLQLMRQFNIKDVVEKAGLVALYYSDPDYADTFQKNYLDENAALKEWYFSKDTKYLAYWFEPEVFGKICGIISQSSGFEAPAYDEAFSPIPLFDPTTIGPCETYCLSSF